MQKSKFWEPLRVGDVVDVIAPGFATSAEKVAGARQFLESLGLRARIPDDLFGEDVVCAQSDEVRFKHLKRAILAKDSKAIWCLRGGYGAVRLVENLAKLKKPSKNKLFVGYSDATTIHNHWVQKWRFSSIHGPLLDRLGEHNLPLEQVNELVEIIFGNRVEVVFENLIPLNNAAKKKSQINAEIIGGNLKVVESELGTRFCKPPQGQIVFFEEIGERGYRVDRMLKHLELAGFFKKARAVLFGDFIEGRETDGTTKVDGVIERFAREMNIPVFVGMEVGHGQNQRPLPLGTPCKLVTGAKPSLVVKAGNQP